MSRLFESIRLENGMLMNLEYHQARMNASRLALFAPATQLNLEDHIHIPDTCRHGLFKCRVVYAEEIERVEFVPYQRKPITSLACVDGNPVQYEHKFENRSSIEALSRSVIADDILIIKNGLVTDTSIANIVFFDGSKWITPASPLLAGTARARLLKNGRIVEDEIRHADLFLFKKSALINAMLDLDERFTINPNNILPLRR